MVEGISKAKQNKITEFVKDEVIYFAIGNQKYDFLYSVNDKGKVQQEFADIMQADVDCENFYRYLSMYDTEFRRFVPKDPDNQEAKNETFLDENGKAYNCYILTNKDMKYIVKALRVVKDYIKQQEEAGKKILLISLMAGHGMIADNEQVLLCNKITKHRFFEMLPIESLIRCIGAEHANVYSITLFACCR